MTLGKMGTAANERNKNARRRKLNDAELPPCRRPATHDPHEPRISIRELRHMDRGALGFPLEGAAHGLEWKRKCEPARLRESGDRESMSGVKSYLNHSAK